jgi:hypothetical protein
LFAESGSPNTIIAAGAVMLAAGGGGFLGLTGYSVFDGGDSIRRKKRPEGQARWLLPAPLAAPGGQTSLGLAFGGSF